MLDAMADPTYPADVADAVRTWLEQTFGGPVLDAVAPTAIGTGFSTLIHFVQFAGPSVPPEWRAPLVVRIHQSVDQASVARREAAIQTWCHDREFPAPRVLMVFEPDELLPLPVQVMERAPGTTMLEGIMKAPWRAACMLERLADLHLRLHVIPIDGWPEAKEAGLAARRLALVRRSLDRHDDSELRDALTRAEQLLPELYAAERVPCHGDFHPLNVMVDGEQATVIDWTDAALGDRHGDVARTYLLFHVAAIRGHHARRKDGAEGVPRVARWPVPRGLRARTPPRSRATPPLGGAPPAPRVGAGGRRPSGGLAGSVSCAARSGDLAARSVRVGGRLIEPTRAGR